MKRKTTSPWEGLTLDDIVKMLWSGNRTALADALHCSRGKLWMLLCGKHDEEPLAMLNDLHQVFQERLKQIGLTMAMGDLREAWKRSSD